MVFHENDSTYVGPGDQSWNVRQTKLKTISQHPHSKVIYCADPGFSDVESFSWKTTLNFGCPTALNDQIEVYYKVDRLLNGLLSL